MLAKKCDRCGVLYEHYRENLNGESINGIRFMYCSNNGGEWDSENHYDLCPRCLQQLKESLNNSSEVNPDEKKP